MERKRGRIREVAGKVLTSRKTFVAANIADGLTAYNLFSMVPNYADLEINHWTVIPATEHLGILPGLLLVKGLFVPAVLGFHTGLRKLDSFVARKAREKGKEHDEGAFPNMVMGVMNTGVTLAALSNVLTTMWYLSLPVVY